MKSCYISAPFGRKKHADGREIDFDRIYQEVIVPAVSETGLSCIRGDEMEAGGVILKSIFSAVLNSEVMIADLSTYSPNIMYELGIRHTARRDVTIIIMAAGAPLPYHMNYNRIYLYELDEQGALTGAAAEKLAYTLTSVIRSSLERVTTDSPLYEFFPDMRVELPEELRAEQQRRYYPRIKKGSPRRRPTSSAVESEDAARQIEQAVRDTLDVDPHAHIEVLKKYRDASAWNDLVRYAEELPPDVSNAPEVMQLLALALNRRGEPGDQERAISLMEQFNAETGGDAESYGILGRIYKDRYETHRRAGEMEEAEKNLRAAIEHYRTGFEKQPTEYYPGVNVVNLLLQRRDEEAKQELSEILPRVKESVYNRMQSSLVGYWELVTAMELACVAHEWGEAEALAEKALDTSPSPWMVETSLHNLKLIEETMDEPSDRERISEVMRRLASSDTNGEAQNA